MEAHSITLMNKTEDDELGNDELSEVELRDITGEILNAIQFFAMKKVFSCS